MADDRDGAGNADESTGAAVRQTLKATCGYGCLLAALLGGGMSVVIFLGNVMGDCTPGPGCHDHDGLHIMNDMAVALPIAAALGVGMWLLAAGVRTALQPIIGERRVIILLVALTLAVAWFGFSPAMEAFSRWTVPATS